MKLNEFKQLQELDAKHLIGNFGASALQQAGNRLMGNGEGQLSVKDRMSKNNFISDFVGRATTNLQSAIEGGRVDINATSSAPVPTQQNTTPTQPNTTTPGATSQPTQPETPEQKRIRLQKAAQQNIDKTATTVKTNAPVAPKTPEQIRQEKQAAATQAARGQMTPKVAGPAVPAPKTPEQIRQEKLAAATQTAQAGMTPKPPAQPTVWKNNRKPSAPAQTKPVFKESTFSILNNIFESILSMDEAEVAQPVQDTGKISISEYVRNMFTKYMKNVNISDPKVQQQIKSLADAVQASYRQDKGQAALNKLANLGYSLSYEQGSGQTSSTTSDTEQPSMGGLSAFARGAGLSQGSTTTPATTQTTTATQTAQTSPEQKQAEKTVYMQVKELLGKLDKKGKQRILAALQKQLPAQAQSTQPTQAQPSAMDNMARQLSARGQTSTGGTQTATGRGVRHTASPTNPNQAPGLDAKISSASKRPVRARTPKATA